MNVVRTRLVLWHLRIPALEGESSLSASKQRTKITLLALMNQQKKIFKPLKRTARTSEKLVNVSLFHIAVSNTKMPVSIQTPVKRKASLASDFNETRDERKQLAFLPVPFPLRDYIDSVKSKSAVFFTMFGDIAINLSKIL